jgi:hypothetical protein
LLVTKREALFQTFRVADLWDHGRNPGIFLSGSCRRPVSLKLGYLADILQVQIVPTRVELQYSQPLGGRLNTTDAPHEGQLLLLQSILKIILPIL